jgi:hypothetical protein
MHVDMHVNMLNMQEICMKYAWNMHEKWWCMKYAWNMHEICMKYAKKKQRNMQEYDIYGINMQSNM